jgi:hypothetical protein
MLIFEATTANGKRTGSFVAAVAAGKLPEE